MIHVYERDGVTCVEGVLENGRIVYAFLVDGMLIDTGAKHLEADLIPFYEEQLFDQVTLTHSHEDHTGTASWIKENKNIPIYIHPKGIRVCSLPGSYPKYRQVAWGIRKEFEVLPIGSTIQSRNLDWEVIYTPGHADDHICLFHKETGRLFSGDLFLGPKPKVILGFESIPETMNSIKTLLSYDFGSMYCGHAGYIQNGKQMMQLKLDYLEYLSGEVVNLHNKGLSIVEINQKLFPKKYPIISFSEGEFDSLHIVTSILSDVEKISS
jgi:endoribonuclease LACTB2